LIRSGLRFAMGGAGQPLDLQLHQALGSETDHLAQKIGVGALFQKRAKGHHLVGHRWILGSVAWFSDQTLPMIRDDHRKPLAHYGAIKSALARGLLRRVTPPAGTRPRYTLLKSVAAPFFCAVCMAAVTWISYHSLLGGQPQWLRLLVDVIIGTTVYCLLITRLRVAAWLDFRELIFEKLR
jgi:hypothetical protein